MQCWRASAILIFGLFACIAIPIGVSFLNGSQPQCVYDMHIKDIVCPPIDKPQQTNGIILISFGSVSGVLTLASCCYIKTYNHCTIDT